VTSYGSDQATLVLIHSSLEYALHTMSDDAYHAGCSRCGQVSAELVFHTATPIVPLDLERHCSWAVLLDRLLPNIPDQLQHRFLLQQWREIDEMLAERVDLDDSLLQIAHFFQTSQTCSIHPVLFPIHPVLLSGAKLAMVQARSRA
jgi:hypothetical protein